MNLLHEVLHEVFEKVLYSVYYQIRDEKQNAPSHCYIEDRLIFFEYFFFGEFFTTAWPQRITPLFLSNVILGSPYNFHPFDNASVTR